MLPNRLDIYTAPQTSVTAAVLSASKWLACQTTEQLVRAVPAVCELLSHVNTE